MARLSFIKSEKLDLTAASLFFSDNAGSLINVVQLNSRELCVVQFAFEIVGTTDDITWEILSGTLISSGNTFDADSSDTTHADLDTVADGGALEDEFKGDYLVVTAGTAVNQARLITAFDTATNDRVTITPAWTADTDLGDTYDIYSLGIYQDGTMDVSILTATPTVDLFHRTPPISVVGPEFLLFRAQGGATDAHNAWVLTQKDGVSV